MKFKFPAPPKQSDPIEAWEIYADQLELNGIYPPLARVIQSLIHYSKAPDDKARLCYAAGYIFLHMGRMYDEKVPEELNSIEILSNCGKKLHKEGCKEITVNDITTILQDYVRTYLTKREERRNETNSES